MPGVRQILGKAGPGRELEGMQFSSDVLCAFVHRFDDELSRQGRLRRERGKIDLGETIVFVYASTVNFHDRSNLFPTFILSSPSFPENSRHEPNIRRDTRDEVNNLLSHLSLPLFGIIIPNSKLERGFSLLNSFHGISYSKTASIPRLGVLPGRTLEPRHLESNINATRTTKRDKFGIISIREEEAGLLRRLRLLSRGD